MKKANKILSFAALATLPLAAGIITPMMINNTTSTETVSIQTEDPTVDDVVASTYIGSYNKTTWVEEEDILVPNEEHLVNINLNVLNTNENGDETDYTVWFSLEGNPTALAEMDGDLGTAIDFDTTSIDATGFNEIYYVDNFGGVYSLENSEWTKESTTNTNGYMYGTTILGYDNGSSNELSFGVTDTTVSFEMLRLDYYEAPENSGDITIDEFPRATVDLEALTTPVTYSDNSTTIALATTFTVVGAVIITVGGWWAYKKYVRK